MDRELAERLIEVLQDIGDYEAELREDYSGRGMFGDTTFAVVFSDFSQLLEAIYIIGYEDGFNEAKESDTDIPDPELEELRIDNMGLRFVVY